MPLSDHEQRILAEIERRLLEEDPKFAHQVGSSFRAHLARRLKLAVAGFILGVDPEAASAANQAGQVRLAARPASRRPTATPS